MRLVALYIHEHSFLFSEPQSLNFGGEFFYRFENIKDIIHISRYENKNFIADFFGKDITGVSAIVGRNGVGKTSVLRLLNNQKEDDMLLLIYEDNDNVIIKSNSSLQYISKEFTSSKSESEELYPLYYSPNIDYNLRDIYSPISQTSLFKTTLEEYFLDNIDRQLRFLNNINLQEELLKIYPELPRYNSLDIQVNNIYKSRFFEIYQETNLQENIEASLRIVWEKYNATDLLTIHQNNNFKKDLEVLLLSLLVIDDVHMQTNDNGNKISLDKDVINQDSFEDILDKYLEKSINNIDEPIYHTLVERLDIKVDLIKELTEVIRKYPILKISGGFEYSVVKKHLITKIERFKSIKDFYHSALQFYREITIDKLILEVEDINFEKLDAFFKNYNRLINTFQYLPAEFRILNFYPDIKLSTGQKSLLDLFSSLSAFVLKKENDLRQKKNYLLLLDEPEQGYHARWKKSFIESITKVFPIIFNELQQNPNIQIVFTTHDALTLSDIPNSNIVYIDKNSEDCYVVKRDSSERPSKSFGANITDLLADSFFIDNGLIGNFAKSKINDTIIWLRDAKNKLGAEYYEKVINIVDEPIIKNKLAEMYSDKMKVDIVKLIRKQEINKLRKEYKNKYNEEL